MALTKDRSCGCSERLFRAPRTACLAAAGSPATLAARLALMSGRLTELPTMCTLAKMDKDGNSMPCRRGEAGRQGVQCCSHPYACHTSTAEPPIALPHQQPQSITACIRFSNPLALSLLLGSIHDGMRRPIDGRRIIPCCCRLSLRLRARRVAATAAATAALAAGTCCDGKAEGPGGYACFGHALTRSCGGIGGAAFLAA